MTILTSNATWCCQGQVSIIGTGQGPLMQQPIVPQSRDNPMPAPGQGKNEVQTLECILLYWAIKITVAAGGVTPDPFIEFKLRRNQATTLATIDFEPLETGTKAQLLNIPIFVNENFDFTIDQFGSGNTFWTWMFAGKLTGTDPNG